MEELTNLKNAIVEELRERATTAKPEYVVYTHRCKDAAKHHLGKYKHWAKLVTGIDSTKTNGYAFQGDFLQVIAEHKVPVGSIIVEVCDTTLTAYRADADGREELGTAKTNSMSSLIDTLAKEFE